jgi:hypothetical protein
MKITLTPRGRPGAGLAHLGGTPRAVPYQLLA